MGTNDAQTKQIVDEMMAYVEGNTRETAVRRKVRTLLEKVGRDASRKNVCRIESAVPLSDVQISVIKNAVEHKFSRTIDIETSVKNNLMGGMRISVDDWVLDTTLKTQLDNLKSSLIAL